MFTTITINIDWNAMIDGSSQSDLATIDQNATIENYKKIVEKSLRANHNNIDEDTEIEFTDDNPRYSHETDDGLDEKVQEILESVWDAQQFWVETSEQNANIAEGQTWGSLTATEKENLLKVALPISALDCTRVEEGACIIDFKGYDLSILGEVINSEIIIKDEETFYNPVC